MWFCLRIYIDPIFLFLCTLFTSVTSFFKLFHAFVLLCFNSLYFCRKSLISEILHIFYEHKSEVRVGAHAIFFPSFYISKHNRRVRQVHTQFFPTASSPERSGYVFVHMFVTISAFMDIELLIMLGYVNDCGTLFLV